MCELSGAKAEIVGDKPRGCGGTCKAAQNNLPCPLLKMFLKQKPDIEQKPADQQDVTSAPDAYPDAFDADMGGEKLAV